MTIITPERLRLVRRSLLYTVAGAIVYVIALTFCFPYDRARDAAVAVAARAGYDLEIGSAGPSFPFGIAFDEVRVRARTAVPPPKPAQARFDSVRVAMLPLAMSHGESFDVVARGLGGEITLAGTMPRKGPFKIDLAAKDIALGQLPGVRETLNLPLTGAMTLTAHLESTTGKYADAHGEVEFKCASCVVGDGKTAAKLGSNPFLAAGLTLPRVRLGELAGRMVVEKGIARAQGIAIKSSDAEVTLDGEAVLRDPLPSSTLNFYLRFKLGDALLKSAPSIATILQMAGAPGLRPDGFYGLRIAGTLGLPQAALSMTSPVPAQGQPPRGGSHTSVAPGAPPPMGAHRQPPAAVPPPPPPPPPTPPPPVPVTVAPPPPPPPPPVPPQPPPEAVAAVAPAAPARVGFAPPPPLMRGQFMGRIGGAPGTASAVNGAANGAAGGGPGAGSPGSGAPGSGAGTNTQTAENQTNGPAPAGPAVADAGGDNVSPPPSGQSGGTPPPGDPAPPAPGSPEGPSQGP